MMSTSLALQSNVFLTYTFIVAGVLAFAGVVLSLVTIVGRDVAPIWQTYRGWLVMVPLVFGALLLGRTATIAGVTLLALFGFREYARATGLYEDWWLTGIVYAAIVAVGITSWMPDPRLGYPGWYGLFIALPAWAIGAIVMVPILRNRSHGQLQQVALAIMGFLYFGWMFSHLGFLANTEHAYAWLLFLVFAVEINDVAAFTSGRLFGRHKLRENISPNKTIEGFVGAVLVSLAVPFLLHFSLPGFTPWQLIAIGLIVGVGGQLGDLVISYIKRDIGIKDMGTTIRGHGGVLDRIDSMIFVVPLFFHFVRWFHGIR